MCWALNSSTYMLKFLDWLILDICRCLMAPCSIRFPPLLSFIHSVKFCNSCRIFFLFYGHVLSNFSKNTNQKWFASFVSAGCFFSRSIFCLLSLVFCGTDYRQMSGVSYLRMKHTRLGDPALEWADRRPAVQLGLLSAPSSRPSPIVNPRKVVPVN